MYQSAGGGGGGVFSLDLALPSSYILCEDLPLPGVTGTRKDSRFTEDPPRTPKIGFPSGLVDSL